jgi:hypothetical protein
MINKLSTRGLWEDLCQGPLALREMGEKGPGFWSLFAGVF